MKSMDLVEYGIKNTTKVSYNPSFEELYLDELQPGLKGYEAGKLTELGAVSVLTGIYTGRSPKDKYIVRDELTESSIWWTSEDFPNDNRPISTDTWKNLKENTSKHLSNKNLYVVDSYCGTNPDSRLKVRFVTEVAWQAHFVKNMFIRPSVHELEKYGTPDFVVLNASQARFPEWLNHGMHSDIYTAFNLTEQMQVIGGTWYGGEMKKGIFAMMNYYLPLKGIAAMHCSANRGENGDVAVFFGLSGTGKTTLSTDPKRALIGDDEHGWDNDGVFNFEGGCYAKTIDLDEHKEPDIYHAIKRDALLENVVVDEDGKIDFHDSSITQNTRVSYPIYHIENIVRPVSRAGHASKVIFLSADAYGVLPPVAKLSSLQTKYHFLSGFTAKVAGTERGVIEPQPTFSACFGEAFLTLHPIEYAHELVHKMEANGATAYLVNTGWNGTGKRISLKDTRGIIDVILNGEIEQVPTTTLPVFNLEIPVTLPEVDQGILDPRDTYADVRNWERKAQSLASLFIENFKKYTDTEEGREMMQGGPILP